MFKRAGDYWHKMTAGRKALWARMLAVCLFTLTYLPFLGLSWHSDDWLFLREISGHPSEWPSLFSVDWGWIYRPVFLLYLSIGFEVTNRSAVLMHAGGLLLQAIAIALLGRLAWRISLSRRFTWLTVFIFILYPVNNEVVWWISANSAILAAIFSLLCLHCWISYRQSGDRPLWLLPALIFFAVALGCKDEAITTPIGCLMLDAILFPNALKSVRRWWPGLLLLAVSAIALFLYNAARLHVDPVHPRIITVVDLPMSPVTSLIIPFSLWLKPFDARSFEVNLWITGLLIYLTWFGRRSRFLIWALLVAMPMGIALGSHAAYPRFQYYPALPFSLFFAYLILEIQKPGIWQLPAVRTWTGNRIFAAALAVPILRHCASIIFGPGFLLPFISDGPIQVMVIPATALVAGVLWRSGKLPALVAGLIVIVALAGQLEALLRLNVRWGFDPVLLLMPAVAAMCFRHLRASANDRDSRLLGAACAVLLWPYPLFSLPLFLVLWGLNLPRHIEDRRWRPFASRMPGYQPSETG